MAPFAVHALVSDQNDIFCVNTRFKKKTSHILLQMQKPKSNYLKIYHFVKLEKKLQNHVKQLNVERTKSA